MFGFRDPRKVLVGRVEAKINKKVLGAKVAARGKVESKVRGAAKKVKGGGKKAGAAAPAKKKAKKKMGWWPFGGEEEAGEAPACHGCGEEVDASWGVCPYCGTSLSGGQAPQAGPPIPNAPAPGGAPSMPQQMANKTMAVNIDALTGPKRQVVGWLVVMKGVQKGTDFRLYDGKNGLGAAADNDIVITDEYLSSRHASIRYEDGTYTFIDNDSTNGSYLNEKKVSKEELIDNDTIRLGRTEMRFKSLY